jgi:cytidyltransferase-like protein
MTIGLLGGTFDPPHNGHVALARTAIETLRLDRLVVVPVREAPHKPVATDAETRFRLAQAAFADVPRTELSRVELEPIPISSRDLRARVARGESIDGLVPPAVARVIEEVGLYRDGGTLKT